MKEVSKSTLERLPLYLTLLKSFPGAGLSTISSAAISKKLGLTEIQVRKDLASVSAGGRPKIGYYVADLIDDLEKFLGYDHITDAVIVGCGKLGRALLDYGGFSEYGLSIVAGFDTDSEVCRSDASSKPIYPFETFEEFCLKNKIDLAILAVPESAAAKCAKVMSGAGIKAVLNFAPVHIQNSGSMIVKNQNIAVSLALLSNQLKKQLDSESLML